MKTYLGGIAGILAAVLCSTGRAAPVAPERLVLILDSSGSMKGRVGKQAKMDVAKAVVGELLGSLPMGLEVGLVAYGHRRKDDCSDVEALVPVGPLNRELLLKKVQALAPQGMTPLTRSVQQVADGLSPGEGAGMTVLLVSDGEETCKADPCALVKALREKGLRFTLHVVGFDVKAKERAQLECMAKEGGGRYFGADSPAALKDALGAVVKEQKLEGGVLALRTLRGGQPLRAEYTVKAEDKPGVAAAGWTSEKGPLEVRLVPGTYLVSAQDGSVRPPQRAEKAGVSVGAGTSTALDLELGGYGTLTLVATRNGSPVRCEYTVSLPGKGGASSGWTSSGGPMSLSLQPASYDVTVADGNVYPKNVVRTASVVVTAGGTTPVEAKLAPTGTLSILVTRAGSPVRVEYALKSAQGVNATSGYTSEKGPLELPFQEGTYTMSARYEVGGKTHDKKLAGIVVQAGQQARAHLALE